MTALRKSRTPRRTLIVAELLFSPRGARATTSLQPPRAPRGVAAARLALLARLLVSLARLRGRQTTVIVTNSDAALVSETRRSALMGPQDLTTSPTTISASERGGGAIAGRAVALRPAADCALAGFISGL